MVSIPVHLREEYMLGTSSIGHLFRDNYQALTLIAMEFGLSAASFSWVSWPRTTGHNAGKLTHVQEKYNSYVSTHPVYKWEGFSTACIDGKLGAGAPTACCCGNGVLTSFPCAHRVHVYVQVYTEPCMRLNIHSGKGRIVTALRSLRMAVGRSASGVEGSANRFTHLALYSSRSLQHRVCPQSQCLVRSGRSCAGANGPVSTLRQKPRYMHIKTALASATGRVPWVRGGQRTQICGRAHFQEQRDLAYSLNGIALVPVAAQARTLITILYKDPSDKRRMLVGQGVLQAIRKRFTDVDIEIHDGMSEYADAQLEWLGRTTIFIANIGSPSFRLIYLPDGAQVCRLNLLLFAMPLAACNPRTHTGQAWCLEIVLGATSSRMRPRKPTFGCVRTTFSPVTNCHTLPATKCR